MAANRRILFIEASAADKNVLDFLVDHGYSVAVVDRLDSIRIDGSELDGKLDRVIELMELMAGMVKLPGKVAALPMEEGNGTKDQVSA